MTAAGFPKPKLVIIVGAGASQAVGLCGVKDLSDQSLADMRRIDGYPADLATLLPVDAATIRAGFPPRSEPLIDSIRRAHSYDNFEHDINLLENLVALSKPGFIFRHTQSPLAKVVNQKSVYEALFDDRCLDSLLGGTIQSVLDKLKADEAALPAPRVKVARDFVIDLDRDFDISLYNFNYDTIFDGALPTFNDGFVIDPGEPRLKRFSAQHFFRGGGIRFAHCHGATNFRVSQVTAAGGSEYGVVKIDPANPPTRPLALWAEAKTQAGDFSIVGSIVTGLRKPDKTRYEPYASYSLGLDLDLQQAERVLIIGYGASDLYLNWQLVRARQFHGAAAWRPVWITLGRLNPNSMIFQLGAWMAGAQTDADLARMFPGFYRVSILQRFNQLHMAGEGWKPDDPAQSAAIKAALA
jgi:hypothetical protein